ncbi:hypothetical protein [Paenibacillus nasutitermitis]|uniref:Uncharacterized protein n=1 Tax=Paenibacillus nasutitermitis TaxID=1652958 RepID=A0A916YMQ6_9BACL|nr:hypothetical protein [Paenibacillus nasutitermitis]GGD51923.1 hypothetical protein GCM10010911_06880 [Paenibacillus nasutitermitis]
MEQRKSVLLNDFSKCMPQEALSPTRPADKWELCPYETMDVKGTMLVSLRGGTPPPVTAPLGLSGKYAIFVCLGAYGQHGAMTINLKLKNDGSFSTFSCTENAQNKLEESFWKCADLTGQDITISKFCDGTWFNSMLAWLRFVPLTDAEWAAYQKEQARKDTKRLYATHDMHGVLCLGSPSDKQEWRYILEDYRDSDVKYFSMENIWIFDGPVSTGDADNMTYFRDGDRQVQHKMELYTDEQMKELFHYGRTMGMELIYSLRMGFWSIEFPYDQMYFTNQFYEKHPELLCINRDGAKVERLSYAYPQVQDYMLDQFSHMAEFDCDGVEMLWNRGAPYLLFEPPFVDEFMKRYAGLDPRLLPLEDARVQGMRCEIMTGFVRRLHERLDRERAERGQKKLKYVARGLLNLDDNLVLGLDFEQWATEGLIDVAISYQLQIRENLTGDVWQDGNPELLDLGKYKRAVLESDTALTERIGDFRFVANIETDFGNSFQLPIAERIAQFKRLEAYGVEVFHDIMPRQLSCEEYRRRALELYDNGAENLSLWDSYGRVPVRATWTMARRLGHKEELRSFNSGEGVLWQHHRLLMVRGINVSVYPPNWG